MQFVSGVQPHKDVQCWSKHTVEVISTMEIFDTKKDSCLMVRRWRNIGFTDDAKS
jgi:hypothetical protein